MRRQFFIGEVPRYDIKDGVVHIWSDEETEQCMPLTTFRRAVADAVHLLREYDASRRVQSIRSHAASS